MRLRVSFTAFVLVVAVSFPSLSWAKGPSELRSARAGAPDGVVRPLTDADLEAITGGRAEICGSSEPTNCTDLRQPRYITDIILWDERPGRHEALHVPSGLTRQLNSTGSK